LKPNTGATAVLVDEFDSGGFKGRGDSMTIDHAF
jgi:hypothetical protein